MIYIAFLRGMNVPGRSVKMKHLRGLFSEMGFTDVRSYIQSGNIFFETDIQDRKVLSQTISQYLQESLGYEVAVSLRTIAELEHVITLDPFRNIKATPDMRLCVVFTEQPIPRDLVLPLRSPKHDMEIIHTAQHEAFVVWHLINGHAPSAKGFQEKILGTSATTRYFHTAVKILEAAKRRE